MLKIREVSSLMGMSVKSALVASVLLTSAQVAAEIVEDDQVTKTWALELPEAAGITNKAPVVITDGNYRLKCWIVSTTTKRLGIGVPNGQALVDAKREAEAVALFKDDNGAYIGSGDLDMRGAITVDGEATDWIISTIGSYSFNSVSAAPFDVCILPTTLLDMYSATFQGCGGTSGFSTFRLHAPNMTGDLQNNTFLVSRAPTVVDLKIPKVTCFGGYWIRTGYVNFLKDTDVSDWDLSSVKLIATRGTSAKTDSSWILRYSKFRGTMHLPSLKWLNPRTFENCPNVNALELGRNGTLEYVGRYAVSNCTALGSIVIGGAATGFTVSTNAFNAANLTNVTFLTTAPTYEEPNSIIFGTEATPARQIAFHIPRPGMRGWDATWRKYILAAREPSAAERTSFEQRFGSYAAQGLVGIVPPAVFRTAQEQWLVCGYSPVVRHKVDVSVMDPRFTADSVTVSPEPDADGCYAAGTQVTLTSHFNTESAQFCKWRGTVSDEVAEQNPLTLTVDRDLSLRANVHHDWIFQLDNPEDSFTWGKRGTISNDVWTIGVIAADLNQKAIYYGTNSSVSGSAWTTRGEGTLDLNGRILWPQEDGSVVQLKGTGYNGNCFQSQTARIPQERFPRSLIFPENQGLAFNQVFRYSQGSMAPTNLVIEDSQLVADLGTDLICSYTLKGGRIVLPKVTTIFSNYSFSMSDTTDVSEWRFDSVTNVVGERSGTWGVYRGPFANQKYYGTLHLPSLADIQTNAFRAASNLDAAEIGSNTVVTKIGTKAFNGCSSLSRLQIRAGKELTVGADSFTGTAKLKFLEFTYEAPTDPTAVDNMLVGTTASVVASAEPPVIYASRAMGWARGRIPNIQAPTEEELAARPFYIPSDGRLLGVWQTADGVRKAWVVHRPSADDPHNTVLIFR